MQVAYNKLVYAAFNTAAIDGDSNDNALQIQQMGFGLNTDTYYNGLWL